MTGTLHSKHVNPQRNLTFPLDCPPVGVEPKSDIILLVLAFVILCQAWIKKLRLRNHAQTVIAIGRPIACDT